MYCTRNVSDSVVWVGASDRRLALFENLFPIPRGVSYNSYLILDEKTALLDTTDASVTRQYLENVSHSLNGKPLDYLIINHMEPDHCANIAELLLRYPHLTLVGNAKTFAFVSQFYDLDLTGRTLTVKEGDTLCLGPIPCTSSSHRWCTGRKSWLLMKRPNRSCFPQMRSAASAH